MLRRRVDLAGVRLELVRLVVLERISLCFNLRLRLGMRMPRRVEVRLEQLLRSLRLGKPHSQRLDRLHLDKLLSNLRVHLDNHLLDSRRLDKHRRLDSRRLDSRRLDKHRRLDKLRKNQRRVRLEVLGGLASLRVFLLVLHLLGLDKLRNQLHKRLERVQARWARILPRLERAQGVHLERVLAEEVYLDKVAHLQVLRLEACEAQTLTQRWTNSAHFHAIGRLPSNLTSKVVCKEAIPFRLTTFESE